MYDYSEHENSRLNAPISARTCHLVHRRTPRVGASGPSMKTIRYLYARIHTLMACSIDCGD